MCTDSVRVALSSFAQSLEQSAQTQPLIAGMKRYAVDDPTGWCFVSYVNVGFDGDLCLMRWMDCPLGTMPGLVLFMLFLACTEFAL